MPESSPEILEIIQNYWYLAKTRRFDHVAITMIDASDDTIACADYAGIVSLERAQYQAMSALRKRLESSIMNWTLPKPDPSLDGSHVVYSVAHDPMCFDYIVWLVNCEMARIREGMPAPLKVGFWLGANPDAVKADPYRMGWLNNVFRPALALIGAVEHDRAIYGTRREMFVTRNIVMASQLGQLIPQLKTDTRSRFPGYVVITLREADHWPHRNSNIDAWRKFAAYLQKIGEKVVFIRDTAKADEPFEDFPTWPEASRDLDMRMAAYQEAKTNWMISNGPIGLCEFSSVPWVQFVPVERTGGNYEPNTGLFWKDSNGINIGGQFPWCRPDQRIVWERDSLENLMAAWDEYAPVLRAQNAA
jgi:hypothetical protein